jgi:hypothetical protein
MRMKPLLLGLAFALLCGSADAQSLGATAVSSCGAAAYSAGFIYPLQQTTTGSLCTNASGGGGGGAVYGPTAVGSPAANPPVLSGGTADGTATGNVGVLKIVSGVASQNTAQVNGVTTLTGAGATGTGSQRTTTAQDTTTIAGSAPGTAGTPSANVISIQGVPGGTAQPISAASLPLPTGAMQQTGGTVGIVAGTAIIGKAGIDQTTPGTTNGVQVLTGSTTAVTQATASNLNATVVGAGTAGSPSGGIATVQGAASMTPLLVTPSAPADPCFASLKSYADFESTSSGGSIITAVSAKKAYICSISILTSVGANVSIIEGTGSSVCTGGTPSGDFLNTGTTAANGGAFAANGGIAQGGGMGTVFANATANQNTCVLFTTSGTPQVNVHVSYVQQ